MKQLIKANLIWAIAGLIITVVGFAATSTFNWDDCAEITFRFAKNSDGVYSDYYSLNGNSELTSYQTIGSSTCKYSLFMRTRTNSTYKRIYSGEVYAKNDTTYNLYDVSFGNWADTKFKMSKTAGTSIKSEVVVAVEN